jgi:chromosome partitioning protein
MKTLATYSIKGGVGKTSAAVNLGALAAADGLRTVLWDLDPQGAASFLFRIKPKVKGGGKRLLRDKEPVAVMKGTDVEGLDLLPADFSYRNLDLELDRRKKPLAGVRRVLAELEGDYDLAILDCPPSISLVSESVFDTADALLVPLIPSTLTMRTFEQLSEFVESEVRRRPQIVAFFSMVDRRKRLHREVVETLPDSRDDIARTAIPAATEVELMGVHRSPVVVHAPRSRGGRAYAELWAEVRERVGI